MDSLSTIISKVINGYIGKTIGSKYECQLTYLDASMCSFVLHPISIKDTHTANLGVNRLKRNIPKIDKECQVLNDDIKVALDTTGNVRIVESTMRICIDDKFNIHCTFGIKHVNKDTDMIFHLDF